MPLGLRVAVVNHHADQPILNRADLTLLLRLRISCQWSLDVMAELQADRPTGCQSAVQTLLLENGISSAVFAGLHRISVLPVAVEEEERRGLSKLLGDFLGGASHGFLAFTRFA
uniref:Uncharacterized protein n=1 Tax=Chromera velia CCMP2878 TaxID=1169474 RepID=A0A0G4GEN4_9ALVE|eukprot:Cvel_4592.t1-p1 / transcript=Cvel_4592.t1 / gene=Cvel_4592 / organism=Chromera_velia_CCMP2878 / gene_product=hypothetical protein / transcript_product=hypothetical protein / location=Cvel_scaffold202:4388-4726(+) / protein_length=113 / sequence_SO=supercontig / SO=protein_coding / is_pseudo=false